MKWLTLILALVFGFIGGYFLAPESSEPDEPIEPFVNASSRVGAESLSSSDAATPAEAEVGTEGAEPKIVSEAWLASLAELDAFDRIGQLHAVLKQVAPADFSALMDQFKGDHGNPLAWQARGLIAARWVQVDPEGMLAYAAEQPSRTNWGLYRTLFGEWAKRDTTAAYAAVSGLDRQSQQAAMQGLLNAVASEEPLRAIEMAQDFYGNQVSGRGRWLFQSIFREWAQRDGASARAAALQLEEGPAKSAALTGAMSEWMDEAPMDALAWLESLPMDSTIYQSRKEVFRNMLNRDFEVAREFIESVDDPVDRREIVENLYFNNIGWQKDFEEVEGIFDWIGTVATGQVYDQRISGIINAMAQKDPQRAMDFVLQMRPGNARMNGLNSIASQLAQSEPQLAFDFVDSLVFEDEKRRALNGMAWQLSKQGLESASVLVAQSVDPLVQQQLAARLSGEWSNFDRATALAWSESLSDESARKSAVSSVLKNWIQADTEGAFAYIQENVAEDRQGDTFRDAFSDWARNDPAEATAWLDQLPEAAEGRRDDIYRAVANTYITHDPMAASEWIGEMEAGAERDQSVEALVNNISRTDPEAGFIWAETVDNVDLRKNTLRRSVQAWLKTDPDAAYEAVVASEIEATEKEPLLKMIEEKR